MATLGQITLVQMLHRALTWKANELLPKEDKRREDKRIEKENLVSRFLFFKHLPLWEKEKGVRVKRCLYVNPEKQGWVTLAISAENVREPSRGCFARILFSRRDDHTFAATLTCDRTLECEPLTIASSEMLLTLVEQMVDKVKDAESKPLAA
jgi:hypothetical protein